MFKNHRDHLAEITPRILFHWFLLSFMAGNINASGFLACGRFTTHLTGFSTLAGTSFAKGEFIIGEGMLAVPVFFLAGVMVSAALIDRRLIRGLRPRYPLVMGIVAIMLLFAAVGGHYNLFGNLGDHFTEKKEFIFMAILSLASGLMNAAVTTSSGAFVRITHLTGITTDLGIGIVRLFDMKKTHIAYADERMANFYRAGNILSFTLGAIAGATLYVHFEYFSFLLPAFLATYATVIAIEMRSTTESAQIGNSP